MTREEAINELTENLTAINPNDLGDEDVERYAFALDMGIKALKEERPHGEWLSHYEYCKKHDCIPSGLIAFWWCNKCEQGVEIPTNFCPNCGASMRKEGATE